LLHKLWEGIKFDIEGRAQFLTLGAMFNILFNHLANEITYELLIVSFLAAIFEQDVDILILVLGEEIFN